MKKFITLFALLLSLTTFANETLSEVTQNKNIRITIDSIISDRGLDGFNFLWLGINNFDLTLYTNCKIDNDFIINDKLLNLYMEEIKSYKTKRINEQIDIPINFIQECSDHNGELELYFMVDQASKSNFKNQQRYTA